MKMNGSIRRFLCGFLLIVSGALAGCSPQYDWRMVSVAEGRVRAMLPAKPASTERELDFEGQGITFVLTSASVDGVLFTVGYAELPETLRTDASGRERLLAQAQASLYRNLGVEPPSDMPDAAEQFSVTGQGRGQALQLEAMAWTTPDALVEGMVIGAAGELPHTQISEFFRELAPDQPPR